MFGARTRKARCRKRDVGCGGRTDDGALALFLLARTAAALFDALEHAFSDTLAPAPPFLLDALALLVVRCLHGL